jgi:hypothetical protein
MKNGAASCTTKARVYIHNQKQEKEEAAYIHIVTIEASSTILC